MLFQDDDDDDNDPSTLKTDARRSFHLSSHLEMWANNNNQSFLAYLVEFIILQHLFYCKTHNYLHCAYSSHNTTQYLLYLKYNTIQCNAKQYNTIQYDTIQYNAMQCNAIQYNTIQYSTVIYSTTYIIYHAIRTLQGYG